MNGEIKFRGIPNLDEDRLEELKVYIKDVFDGKFVYGNLIQDNYIVGDVMDVDDEYISFEYWIPVIPETVGIFTSKTDKERNELYSGDIIELYDGSVAEIKFGEHEMYCPYDDMYMVNVGFYVSSKKLLLPMPLGPTESYALKLGNIHDNPELFEVSNA